MSEGPALRRRRDDRQTTRTVLKPIDTPYSDEGETIACPACGRDFTPSGRARYCSDACRKKAWRRRHQAAPTPVVLPPGIARRPITVYECAFCGGRSVGEQRCIGCGTFMARVGLGGRCPHCDEPVAVDDLLDSSAPSPRGASPPERSGKRRRAPTTGTQGGRR